MKKLISFSMVIILIAVTCSAIIINSASAGDNISDDEYEVYMAVIEAWNGEGNDCPIFVIGQETYIRENLDSEHLAYFKKMTGIELDSALVIDFNSKNYTSYLLNMFNLAEQIVLISKQEMQELFSFPEGIDWNKFSSEYPMTSEILQFSRVGFNKDHTQAIFFLRSIIKADFFAATGYLILLTKENRTWKIQVAVPQLF